MQNYEYLCMDIYYYRLNYKSIKLYKIDFNYSLMLGHYEKILSILRRCTTNDVSAA